MPDPEKYSPKFNYSGWEAAGSKRPKPGASLDTDFANIARSIDETIDALKDLRRSDGKLKNGTVGPDAFDEAARDLIAGSGAQKAAEEAKQARDESEAAKEDAESAAQEAADTVAGTAKRSQNLSDLTDLKAARSNLGTFSTVADVENSHVPMVLESIRTLGWEAPGDGGGMDLVKSATDPGYPAGSPFSRQSADGAFWIRQRKTPVRAEEAGLSDDNDGQDNSDAFGNLIDYLKLPGINGGVIEFEAREYASAGMPITGANNVHLRGIPGKSRIAITPGLTASGLSLTNVQGFSISGLAFDCNGDVANGGHGLRFDGCQDGIVRDIAVLNAHDYGVGLQGFNAHQNLMFENILIDGAGGDGFDIKNRSSANKLITLSRVVVKNFGQRSNNQAGIDVRGPCDLSRITVENFGVAGQSLDGIRFRFGESNDDPPQLGGHLATLSTFRVRMLGGPGTNTGLKVDARNIRAAFGVIEGGELGVAVHQAGSQFVGITRSAGTDGWRFRDLLGLPTAADRNSIVGCTVGGSSGIGFDVDTDYNSFSACHVRGAATAYLFNGNNNSIIGGSVTNNSTPLSDNGSGNRASAVAGMTDK